jgi:hypothetical protein
MASRSLPTPGAAEPLTLDRMLQRVALSQRIKTVTDAFTPAEAAAHARRYSDTHEEYLRSTVAKREQGYGDCSVELDAAERRAVRRMPTVPVLPARQIGSNLVLFPQRRERVARNRARRDRSTRSSARSGDSGSDDGESEPPAADRWRWASEAGWRSFVASIESRDFEREVHLERWSGRRA